MTDVIKIPVKVMLVFGTRPEAIKMAPVLHALLSKPEEFEVVTCVTGQHRQMLDQVLQVFGIKPDIDLDLMRSNQDPVDIVSSMLCGVRDALLSQRPDIVLVHGDTATTLAASMASFLTGYKVLHVEAGLRTFDINAPFPEEFNRQVVGRIATIHCVPTLQAKNNLLREGVDERRIVITGNTVIDALIWVLQRIDQDSERKVGLEQELSSHLQFDWKRVPFVLITGHRRENFGRGFLEICDAIATIAEEFPQIELVYPVHLNPNVAGPVRGKLSHYRNIHLISPLGYEQFSLLLRHCYIVLTDSGGVQEEAPSLGKPVLVMRETTERPEAVEAGTVVLVGARAEKIVAAVRSLLNDRVLYLRMSQAVNPYGDGHAAQRILDAIKAMGGWVNKSGV